MDRSVFEILDAIGVNLLRLLIHDYLPQRFHAKQFYDLLINHHPLEYRENCYHKYTSHNNNSSQVSYWQHR